MTADNFCFYLQNRLIQTSQTGGQVYSDTSPFSIPWFDEMKYHCSIDLMFDWFGISHMTTDNFCIYFQNRLIQGSQTGGQQYSDTSPFSIPWQCGSVIGCQKKYWQLKQAHLFIWPECLISMPVLFVPTTGALVMFFFWLSGFRAEVQN
jgi:hypothetical protein